MTLAMTVRPCMSIPGAEPRISSIRSTSLAEIRLRTESVLSDLEATRCPSISTFEAAPANPRTLSPPS